LSRKRGVAPGSLRSPTLPFSPLRPSMLGCDFAEETKALKNIQREAFLLPLQFSVPLPNWDRTPNSTTCHVISRNVMDSVCLVILSLIQNDARVAHASVGERLGLTAPAVHARIKRLERDGIIRGYLTSIDPLAVNQTLLAFVRVMNNAAGKDEQFFEQFVRG